MARNGRPHGRIAVPAVAHPAHAREGMHPLSFPVYPSLL